MKIKYLFVLIMCLLQTLMAQTMHVHKTDQTKLDFQLADIDSITISTASLGKATSAEWTCFTNTPAISIAPSAGVYEEVEEGLKIYGNGNLYDNEVQLIPRSINSAESKTIFLKWKASGNGNNTNVAVELFSSRDNLTSAGKAVYLSTKQSGAGSSLICNDTWYYTRISVAFGKVTSTTSTGNFDINGGTVASSSTLSLSSNVESYSFQIYGDNNSCAVLAESWTE